jgi:deoxyribodipyrimidine photolyase
VETAIVLFTRDLRVRDNPALALPAAQRRQLGYSAPLVALSPA